ncbi:MAG: DNA-binding protein [Idiomarina sp.]|nr:DNA-binding protein [Idiomarina sp.]
MARGGITKKSVEQARNALIARGESVSIDAVRIELGNTGSKTTIHRYLKELETDDDKTALSASLSDELIALVNQLSSRLKAEANQTLEAQEERHSEQVNAWQERFEQQSQELLATHAC